MVAVLTDVPVSFTQYIITLSVVSPRQSVMSTPVPPSSAHHNSYLAPGATSIASSVPGEGGYSGAVFRAPVPGTIISLSQCHDASNTIIPHCQDANKSYKCPLCPEHFEQWRAFIGHVKSSHSDHYMCPVCYKLFDSQSELDAHTSIKHSLSIAPPTHQDTATPSLSLSQCTKCNDQFSSSDLLTKHVETIHGKIDYVITSTLPSKTVKQKSANKAKKPARDTEMSDSNEETTANKSTSNRSPRGSKGPHSCSYCSESLSSQCDLTRHLLQHTGEKPYTCELCCASFTRKSSLNNHTRIHTGHKPYTCVACDASFSYRYQFNRHKIMHQQEEADITE